MSKRILSLASSFILLAMFSSSVRADEITDAMARGYEAYQLGQYERALFEYRTALQWPGAHEARAHFNSGVCHYQRGRLREAAAAYRAALKLRNEQYPAASYALGLALRDRQEAQAARAAFAQAVRAAGGKHAAALFELGLAAQRAGDDGAATSYYQQAITQERLPASHNNLGVLLAQRGQLDEAMQEFATALALARGQFTEAHANLVLCRQLRAAASASMIAQLRLSHGGPARVRGE